ncbi:MAG: 30S ribosomal protein S2 [Candidatus Alcyoniella australis]|nr:30S ribosomal protein S2 [Candidatus Alcyoniella australis]
MPIVSLKTMLEAGVHFGHQTKRWNPKMKRYIFGARNGIYILDLQQTVELFDTAYRFVASRVAMGEKVLFVGTKSQAVDIVVEEAERAGMHWISNRWLGGTLTNYATIKRRIERYKYLEELEPSLKEAEEKVDYTRFNKKSILKLRREKDKLAKNLKGLRDMGRLPGVLFVIDCRKDHLAIHEANLLNIPIVALVDTNTNPEPIDFPVPSNDDAIRAIQLFAGKIADACVEGQKRFEEAVRSRADREGIDVRRSDEMPRPVEFDQQVGFEIVAKRRVPVAESEAPTEEPVAQSEKPGEPTDAQPEKVAEPQKAKSEEPPVQAVEDKADTKETGTKQEVNDEAAAEPKKQADE